MDGIKVYRNLLAGIEIHRCQNIRIANSFFADNTVSIDIDRTVGVEVINTTIIGESDSYRNLFGREQNIYNMCDRTGKRVGIELHTWSVETNWTAAKISNVTLLGFNRTSACSITSSIAFDTNVRTRVEMKGFTAKCNSCRQLIHLSISFVVFRP